MYVALSHGSQKLGFENAAESFHAVRNEKKISCDISFFENTLRTTVII